jgi:hypothetical protein
MTRRKNEIGIINKMHVTQSQMIIINNEKLTILTLLTLLLLLAAKELLFDILNSKAEIDSYKR